jgi:phosphoglycolate phosphatase
MKLSISSGDHMKPVGVVFDLDGTLIDSREDIAAACNHVLHALGRAPLSVDTIASFVGDGARMLVARALDAEPSSTEVEQALAIFHPFYEAHPAVHTTLMPGARELLDALGDRPLAIVTNKPRRATLACLDALGVTARFMAIRAGGDGPLKPDPSGVTGALASMRVGPAQAWMIGDGEQDVIAGRAAGCVTVGVRGGFQDAKLEAATPDMLVGSLLELITLLRIG